MRTPRKTTQEQIDLLNIQIEKVQANLDKLNAQRDALLEKQKEERLAAIYELMTQNGLSIEELEEIIRAQGQEVA